MSKAVTTLKSRRRERDLAPITHRLTDVAVKLGISEAGVRDLIRRGVLSARRIGRSVVVPADELARFVANLPRA